MIVVRPSIEKNVCTCAFPALSKQIFKPSIAPQQLVSAGYLAVTALTNKLSISWAVGKWVRTQHFQQQSLSESQPK
jgi:hypothetical protein